nr:MAG TPA: Helix-turn-helix XRE-family like protein [Caudoviricetes sp.]
MKANKIREYREKAKLTQQELGAIIGKSQIAISLYESGERTPSIKVSKAIAKALNATLDSIFMP